MKLKVLFLLDLTQSFPIENVIKIFPVEATELYLKEQSKYDKIKTLSWYTPRVIEHGTFADQSAPKLQLENLAALNPKIAIPYCLLTG